VLRDLAGFQPDLVHVATEFPMGFMGLGLARDLKLPILASAHTDYERYAGRYGFTWAVSPGWVYLRWFYGQAALVLAPSRTYEQHLNQRGISHTGVWSRGVDPLVFSPVHRSSAYRAELGIIPEDPLVTYIGRVAPEKGIESLLDAWATLGERRGRAQLAIVGGGLMEAEIRRRRLPAVHLMGRLTGTALSTAYASADVLVFPSATETFGNVLLEGMASGLACLAIGAGGVTTFARDGENAILLPPGDAPAMSAALGRLIADAELRARLGRSARDSALRLGWEPVFDRLFEDYRRVTGTAGRYRAA
jgi:glycosyltransferase involved in cell wall biosynthesis